MTPVFTAAIALAAAGAPAAAAPAQGVSVLPAAYFAQFSPTTALDMVNHLPGFTLDTGSAVRGFEGAAGNVLIEGSRPTSKSDTVDAILARIPAGEVDRIELIRGGRPGIDMQGKTVLANVILKNRNAFRGSVQLVNRFLYDGRNKVNVKLQGSSSLGPGVWDGEAKFTEGFDDGVGPGSHVLAAPDHQFLQMSHIDSHADVRDGVLTGGYEQPLWGGKVRVNGMVDYENYRFNEVNSFTVPSRYDLSNEDGQEELQTEFGANYQRPLTRRTSLELVFLRQGTDFNYESNSTLPKDAYNYRQIEKLRETIGRAVLKFKQTDRLSWEAGGEFADNTLFGDTTYQENDLPIELPAAVVNVEEKRGEVFLKTIWQPTAAWTFDASLHEEGSNITAVSADRAIDTSKTLYYFKPRFTAAWQATGSTQLRARIERVVGQLDFNSFVSSASLNEGTVTAGNVDLVPEQDWIGEVTLEQRFHGADVVLAARHYAIDDTIDLAPIFSPSGVFDAPANIGKGTRNEVQLNLTVPLGWTGLKGGEFHGFVTRRWSEVTDPTTGEKREISNLKPIEWEAHYSQPIPRLKSVLSLDAYSGWRQTAYRFDEVYHVKLKTFVVLTWDWKPKPGWLVEAYVNNLTQRGLRRTRLEYAGLRGSSPLLYTDDRDLQPRQTIGILLRKNFGR